MTRTSCVRHKANTRFFIKYEDILDLCDGDQAKAAAHRVLETRTNDQLTALEVQGKKKPSDEELWITMRWEDFVKRSLGDREKTSFRRVLPELVKDGYVLSRYVKLDEDGITLVCDASNQPYTYATYREAKEDTAVPGLIVNQYRYLYKKVNRHLNTEASEEEDSDEPPPPPPPEGNEPPTGKGKGSARGGNLQNATASSRESTTRGGNLQSSSPVQSISSHAKNGMGDSTEEEAPAQSSRPPCSNGQPSAVGMGRLPCSNEQRPPAQMSSNKNLLRESVGRMRKGSSSAHGFTEAEEEHLWTMEAVLNLAAQYLPTLPEHVNAKQRTANQQRWQEAAHTILTAPRFRQIPESDAVTLLVQFLSYMTKPHSPSFWVCDFGYEVRLWHLANNIDRIYRDMTKYGWYYWPPLDQPWTENENEPGGESTSENQGDMTDQEPTTPPELTHTDQPHTLPPPLGLTPEETAMLFDQIEQDAPNYPEIEQVRPREDGIVEVYWHSAWNGTRYCSDIAELAHWPMLLEQIRHGRLSWRQRWYQHQQQRKAG